MKKKVENVDENNPAMAGEDLVLHKQWTWKKTEVEFENSPRHRHHLRLHLGQTLSKHYRW